MTAIPDVSVIIPTFDALAWLPAAIASVGPDPRIEILVVDDGSADGTRDWLARQAADDRRLVVLHSDKGGPSRARNLAIAASRAPLIAFLDADDTWAPGKLDVQLAFHRAHPDLGFSFTDYRHVTTSGESRGGCFEFYPRFARIAAEHQGPFVLDNALAALFAENVVGTSTVMVRTDLLRQAGGFGVDLLSAEDWDLWLTLAQRAPVGVVPSVLADYLMHRPGNVSNKMWMRIMAVQAIASRHQAAALRQDPAIRGVLRARLYGARAEVAEASGRRLRAAALRMLALVNQPTRRAMRAVPAALLGRHG